MLPILLLSDPKTPTDIALKLEYASSYSSILDFTATKLDLILLPQLLPVTRKVSGGSYLSKTMAWPTQKR